MPFNHLILCCPLLLQLWIFPSIRVFSNESTLHIRWTKYWSFSFNISPSNEHPGLISFRMDWLDLLAVQGTLKSLFQHQSSKASILLCSAFFIVQLSHPYMTTGKTIALTRWTFVGKGMSLLFNMLSKLVIIFLPRSKCLLISWLQSPFAVIFFTYIMRILKLQKMYWSSKTFFFYWRIIALQCCGGFCWMSAWISDKYISLPFWAFLPPLHSTPLGHHRAPGWALCVILQFPASYLFYTW